MKKYITIISIALGLAAVCGCDKFLDVQPEGNPTSTTYFANDQQAIDAIDFLYARYQQEKMFGREIFWEQAGANQVVFGRSRGYNTLATLEYSGDESPLRDVFKECYNEMAYCNFVVKKLTEKQAKTTLTPIESRSLGEAYFMRAFYHFYIAYRYGTDKQGVPFVAYEEINGEYDNSIPEQKKTVMENYGAIISDLTNAEKLLPKFEDYSDADRGRAHKAAAVGYMAKTYAYWATWDKSQWDNVITCVNRLETEYGRELAKDYNDLFSSDLEKYWTKEYLWSIPGNGGATGGGSEFPGVCLENKGWGVYNGWGQHKPTLDAYKLMAEDNVAGQPKNVRLSRSMLEYGDKFKLNGVERSFFSASDIETGFMINKWMDPFSKENMTEAHVNPNGDWPTARVNFHILRFADCLLLRAEAYLNSTSKASASNALKDINAVRTRAGLTPATSATMAQIYHERFAEFAYEGADHLADVKRWAVSGAADVKALALAELNSHPQARHYVNRADPESEYTEGDYEDYKIQKVWSDHKIVFPYPSAQVTLSGGKLKQNAGY
ncbi:MAG: RagB/SusD family nutrient uptake outer membrane protein [Bacteroidales bacterium]|nr:RagB/SusD family nutrient uptake outer membrane protein [Bacteroidales bacterium]